MENTCIKVLDVEHGKKVIEYYKSLGVDTLAYNGLGVGNYYGIFGGVFNFFTEPNGSKVIELPTEKLETHADRLNQLESLNQKIIKKLHTSIFDLCEKITSDNDKKYFYKCEDFNIEIKPNELKNNFFGRKIIFISYFKNGGLFNYTIRCEKNSSKNIFCTDGLYGKEYFSLIYNLEKFVLRNTSIDSEIINDIMFCVENFNKFNVSNEKILFTSEYCVEIIKGSCVYLVTKGVFDVQQTPKIMTEDNYNPEIYWYFNDLNNANLYSISSKINELREKYKLIERIKKHV